MVIIMSNVIISPLVGSVFVVVVVDSVCVSVGVFLFRLRVDLGVLLFFLISCLTVLLFYSCIRFLGVFVLMGCFMILINAIMKWYYLCWCLF